MWAFFLLKIDANLYRLDYAATSMTNLSQHSIPMRNILLHRAFYFAVSKARWSLFQKRVLQFWQTKKALSERSSMAQEHYVPLLKKYLQGKSDDIDLLEIGCGPVCAIQYLDMGGKTYVDPLIVDYKRLFPGMMPESGTYITSMAEHLKLPKASFDVVVCLDTLSDVLNPELVLNNMRNLLKDDGLLFVSMIVWPSWLARIHLLLAQFAPTLPRFNRLYSYTERGFRNSLSRHVQIIAEQKVMTNRQWFSLSREIIFVCKPYDSSAS